MAAQAQSDDDDDVVTGPMKVFLLDDYQNSASIPVVTQEQEKEQQQEEKEEEEEASSSTPKQKMQQHYLSSIDSKLVSRQLPSQGLSFQLWPAATTLVTLLDHHRRCHSSSPLSSILASLSKSNGPDHPLKILELGSGTGLVGIAAAVLLSANVTVTDLPHVISNLQFNVDANVGLLALHGGAVHVAPLRWGEEGDVEALGKESFDLVLASDVVYHDRLFDPLLKTLRLLLLRGDDDEKKEKKKTVFVMAHLRRWKKDSVFFKKAKKVFDVETIHKDNPCDGSRTGVVVYSFAGKSIKKIKN